MRRFILSCAVAALMLSSAAVAQTPTDRAIQEHLRAGEFAPAVALANQAPPLVRDQLLNKIADAQAQAGMRRQALSTASGMASDVYRSRTVSEVANQPVGNFGNFGAAGGMGQPDFDSLMELIKSTVAPTTWDDTGGNGSMDDFATGVYVDAKGMVHSLLNDDTSGRLRELRLRFTRSSQNSDARRNSPLRKVSLTRLERAVQLRLAAGDRLDDEMRLLAGLQRISYVMVYPETGDLVIAGPAGDWRPDAEGRLVGVESNRPVIHLDDLVVVLRHMTQRPGTPFGVSIRPIQENLAHTKAFLAESAKRPLKSGQRGKWLKDLRDNMGEQRVVYNGIDPRTRVARVLFEADYRMKLVGIGLEPGTLEVPSYLSTIRVPAGQAPPPMDVLRWWFTLNYDAILASDDRDAYELRGQGAKVLSENEMIDALGRRIHTGKSDPLNAEFAHRFTKHFDALCDKYPVYADLRNIFDLALACSLLQDERLADRANWHMTCFCDPEQYQVPLGEAAELVQSVINHRIINRTQILAAASGGVVVDPARYTAAGKIETDRSGQLGSKRHAAQPETLGRDAWWWD